MKRKFNYWLAKWKAGLVIDDFDGFREVGFSDVKLGKRWNRLNYVSDAVANSSYTDDIETMAANNFNYDELGQLISDASENIQNIEWRKGDKKIKKMVRNGANGESELEFKYNPFGQRVLKINRPRVSGALSPQSQWKYTYYTYDANGQVMAVYDVKMSATLNSAVLEEQHLYGASRLGMLKQDLTVYDPYPEGIENTAIYANKVGQTYFEINNYLGNVNAVITDRKSANLTPSSSNASTWEAVVMNTSDYYPFGMQMPGRSNSYGAGVEYRYGYIGIEKDNEVSGNGNQLSTEFRQYDPRLGRWFAPDQLKRMYPSNSQYSYALNNPIAGKDENGLYTIFVNGYIYGAPNYIAPSFGGVPRYVNDDIAPNKPYWSERGSEFIRQAHVYLGDYREKFVNGTGSTILSTAGGRQQAGLEEGKRMARELIEEINVLNHDGNPKNDVYELNFVTHSMGAAFAEGMIEEFMKHEELKKLLEKGQIIHLSACDADEIKLPESSKGLERKQLNIIDDKTLYWADGGSRETGGYRIDGVDKFGVIDEKVPDLHPGKTLASYDPHFDTKSMFEVWNYMRALDAGGGKIWSKDNTKFLKKGDAEKHPSSKGPKPSQGRRKF